MPDFPMNGDPRLTKLISPSFDVALRADDVLSYDVRMVKGGATVGVLDAEADRWIAQVNLVPGSPKGQLYFVAPGRRAHIVVANFSSAERASSSFEISALRVCEAEQSPQPTLA